MKKWLAIPIAIVLFLSTWNTAVAAGGLDIPAGATQVKGDGSSFDHKVWTNTFDISGDAADVAIWHFVDSGTDSSTPPIATEMKLLFNESDVFSWNPGMGFSTNGGGNNPGWVVITPIDWVLTDGYLLPALGQFNLSGYVKVAGYRTPKTGSLAVSVDATKEYTKLTYQPYWQKTIEPQWQKTYQPMWQKTLEPQWQKTMQPVWQKTIQPIRQVTYQPYLAPVYEKKVSSGGSDTLVTRLTYSGTDAKAVPTNGGTFKNGHTYVAVNVKAASAPGGVQYTIADSSYNSNGKKTPSEYNRPIGYQYTITMSGGKLTVSFDNRLISASVGVYVSDTLVVDKKGVTDADSSFPGNAPKHYPNSVTVDAVDKNGDGIVYAYVHIEGGSLTWYTTGKYELVGYRWVRNDVVSDELVRSDVVSDVWVRDDLVSDEWVSDKVVSDEWVRDDLVGSEPVSEPFVGDFDVAVTNAAGTDVCSGTLAKCASVDGLKPGVYTVKLSLDGVDLASQDVTVSAGKQAKAAFSGVVVKGDDVTVKLPKIYLDPNVLDNVYLDDVVLDKVYLDDIVLDKVYLDNIVLDKTYMDDAVLAAEYLPAVFLDPIKLGDADAIYLN